MPWSTRGDPVEFSILVSSSNAQRVKMATMIQEDLSQLGINIHVVSLEFGAVVNRLLKSHDYEACIMGWPTAMLTPRRK